MEAPGSERIDRRRRKTETLERSADEMGDALALGREPIVLVGRHRTRRTSPFDTKYAPTHRARPRASGTVDTMVWPAMPLAATLSGPKSGCVSSAW